MARGGPEGGPGVLLTVVPLRGLHGRRSGGPTTARADTLVKPEASGATSPSTVRLTLLPTLTFTAELRPYFYASTSPRAE